MRSKFNCTGLSKLVKRVMEPAYTCDRLISTSSTTWFSWVPNLESPQYRQSHFLDWNCAPQVYYLSFLQLLYNLCDILTSAGLFFGQIPQLVKYQVLYSINILINIINIIFNSIKNFRIKPRSTDSRINSAS